MLNLFQVTFSNKVNSKQRHLIFILLNSFLLVVLQPNKITIKNSMVQNKFQVKSFMGKKNPKLMKQMIMIKIKVEVI